MAFIIFCVLMESACLSLQDFCSLAPLLTSSLKELDLTSCVVLTDSSVRSIASYLPGLQVLRLGLCKLITDWGLLGMEEPSDGKEPSKHTVRKLDIHSGREPAIYYPLFQVSYHKKQNGEKLSSFLCLTQTQIRSFIISGLNSILQVVNICWCYCTVKKNIPVTEN